MDYQFAKFEERGGGLRSRRRDLFCDRSEGQPVSPAYGFTITVLESKTDSLYLGCENEEEKEILHVT